MRAALLIALAALGACSANDDRCAPLPPATVLHETYCPTSTSKSGICFLEADTGF